MALVAGSGSAQLAALAVRLKVTGDREKMKLQLTRALKSAAEPLAFEVKAAATDMLPKRGGLNIQVAAQKVSLSVRYGARTAGVRMTTTAPDTAMTDSGFVRHPVYGNRKKWVVQEIPAAAGWWSKTLADGGPDVTKELLAMMEGLAEYVQAGMGERIATRAKAGA